MHRDSIRERPDEIMDQFRGQMMVLYNSFNCNDANSGDAKAISRAGRENK
jgi:hypothetical protein